MKKTIIFQPMSKKLREKLKNSVTKITLANDSEVQKNKIKMNKLLCILGHPEALVTDYSMIADFVLSDRKLKSIQKKLGFELKDNDFLIDVVKKMGPSYSGYYVRSAILTPEFDSLWLHHLKGML